MGGRFKPGESGNSAGRPRGARDKRTELRELLKPHAPDLIRKAVELALEGDTTALRLCLERLVSPLRATDEAIAIPRLTGSLSDQGAKVIRALGGGKVTPSDAASILSALGSQARIQETDELAKRIEALEQAAERKA